MLKTFGNGVINRSRLVNPEKHYDIIAVTSGKGGVGKSTMSANLAIGLHQMNKKILLMDADLHLGNIDLIFGIRTDKTIADVAEGNASLEEVIISTGSGIDILPASSAVLNLIEKEDFVLKKLADAFEKFEHNYDFILIDTGAGISQTVISFLLGSDKVILIVTPDPASITDAYAVIKVLSSVNSELPVYLTVNMVNSVNEGETIYKKLNLMVQKFLQSRLYFGGAVLKDDMIGRSVKKQRPFVLDHPNSVASNSIRVLNRRIIQAPRHNSNKSRNVFDRLRENKKIQFEWIL